MADAAGGEYWYVIYKAIGDFSDLIKDAAVARAAMQDLGKAAQAEGQMETDASSKSAQARKNNIETINAQRRALEQLAQSAKSANSQTLYGGRNDMGQHLADLQQEQRWQELLLRARNLGFTSPQAAYSWRQLELQQSYLMNRARFGATSSGTGFTTPNEYLAYLQREYTAQQGENQVLLARAQVYKQNADAVLNYASALRGHNETFGTLSANSSQSLAGISQFQSALVGLPDQVSTTLNIDDNAALSKLAVYQAILRGVPQNITTHDVITAAYAAGGVNIPGAMARETIPVALGGPYEQQINSLVNDLLELSRDRVSIPVSFNLPDKEQVASFAASLPVSGPRQQMTGGTNVSAGPPAAAAHAYENLAQAETAAGNAGKGASDGMDQLAASTLSAGGAASFGRGWWRLLSREVQLFGGLLPGMLGHIALWHILLDAVIESLAVLIPAAVALTAWAYAAIPAVIGVGEHLYSIWVVSKSLNTAIPPLTNNFKQFQDAVKPQVIQLYGDAIDVMNSKSGALGKTAVETGGIIDKLGARIAVALQSPSTGKFLESAVADFGKVTDFFANIFGTVGNVLKLMPGYAEILLGILDGISKAIETVTGSGLGSWLIGVALAFHGAVVWGGLFGTGILGVLPLLAKLTGGLRDVQTGTKLADDAVKDLRGFDRYKTAVASVVTNVGNIGGALATAGSAVAGFFPKMAALGGAAEDAGIGAKAAAAGTGLWKTALTGLSAVPVWGWVALGAVALAGLVFWLSRGKDATDKWIESTDKAISSASNWQSLPTLFDATTQAQTKLDTAQKNLTTSIDRGRQSAQGSVKDFQGMSTAAGSQAADIDKLSSAHDRYGKQLDAEVALVGKVADRYGISYVQAVGLANIAGVKLSDITDKNSEAFKVALQQIEGLADGYRALGQQGGMLGNDVEAVNLGLEIQSTQIDKLNQGWDTFIGLVTGGESTFGKFGQDMNTLATAAQATGASFEGVDKASLSLRTGFTGAIQDGGKLLDQLREQVTVTGNAKDATALLTRGGKDLIATLLPMASQSKAAQAQVFALAQAAGYDGVNSLKALTKWTGDQGATKAEKDLSAVTDTLTTKVSDLATDYENLANVLASDVNSAMADSVLKAEHAQTAFLDFAQGVKDGTEDSKKFKDASDEIIKVLLQESGNNVPKAKAAFEAYMLQLGQTKEQADKLWGSLSGRVSVELANEAVKSVPQAKQAFITFAKDGLKVSQAEADNLWSEITGKLGPQLDALTNKHTPAAKAAFVDWAMNGLHLTKTQAQDLWSELNTLQGRIDSLHGKDIKIHMDGSGLYTVTGSAIAASQGKGGSGNAAGGLAFGGYIDKGTSVPKADDVAAWLSRGEYVVQADAVDQYGIAFLEALNAKKLPRYASGGSVSRSFAPDIPSLQPMPGDMDADETRLLLNTEVSEMRSAIKRAKAAAQAAQAAARGTAPPGAVSGAIGELPANWQEISSYLAGHGFTHAWAAGVGGNIFVESGGNPNIWEASGGGGYGLIQWTPPPPGLVGSGLIGELNQIVREGTSFFNGAQTPSVAALEYLMNRERPANPAATAGTREASANAIFKAMGWSGGGYVPGFADGGMPGFATGGSAGWKFPAPSRLHAYDVTDKGFRLGWDAVKGPQGQKPSGYTVETYQLNNKLVDKFIAHMTSTAEYGAGGRGLHPAWDYRTFVWANGGPQAPPHATMMTPLHKAKTVAGLPAISTTAQNPYETWFSDYQLLDRDVHQEISALWALNNLTNVGKKGGPTKGQATSWTKQLHALQAKQKQVIGLGVKPPGLYDKVHGYFDHPQDLPPDLWSAFTSGLGSLEKQQAGYPLGFRYEPDRSKALHNQLLRLQADAKTLNTAWKGTFGGGSGVLTPGAHKPPASQPIGGGLINIPSLITGGPMTPVFGGPGSPDMGFAGGGTVYPYRMASGGPVGLQQVAGMFSGVMPGSMLVPSAMPGGIPDAYLRKLSNMNANAGQEMPRKLSQAGAAHKAAFNVEQLTINNPVAEQPSLSIARSANRLAFLAGRGES